MIPFNEFMLYVLALAVGYLASELNHFNHN